MKIISLILFFLPWIVLGQDSAYVNPGLNELIISAINNNPSLAPVQTEKKIINLRKDEITQPAPMIELMADDIPTSFNSAGVMKLVFSQMIKTFGKLEAERKFIELKSILPEIEAQSIRNELIMNVKENYFMLYLNESEIEFNKEMQELIQSIIQSTEISYSSGKGSQYQIMKSNDELQKLILEEIELRNLRKKYMNELSRLSDMNLRPGYKTRNIELLLGINPPELDTLDLFVRMKINNPEFSNLKMMKKIAVAERNIIDLENYPDFTFKSGYMYNTEMMQNMLMFSVMIDLSFVPWNKDRIKAKLRQSDLEVIKFEQILIRTEEYLKRDVMNSIIELQNINQKIGFLRSTVIPQNEITLSSLIISYETASNDYMSMIDSYRMLRENELKILKLKTEYLINIAKLEYLLGSEIFRIN